MVLYIPLADFGLFSASANVFWSSGLLFSLFLSCPSSLFDFYQNLKTSFILSYWKKRLSDFGVFLKFHPNPVFISLIACCNGLLAPPVCAGCYSLWYQALTSTYLLALLASYFLKSFDLLSFFLTSRSSLWLNLLL